jgi:hypothetical protein
LQLLLLHMRVSGDEFEELAQLYGGSTNWLRQFAS